MQKADILLRSNVVFSGLASAPEAGFVAISGNRILAAGATVLARRAQPDLAELSCNRLDPEFGDVPVILFIEGGESCYMNSAAHGITVSLQTPADQKATGAF